MPGCIKSVIMLLPGGWGKYKTKEEYKEPWAQL